MRGKHIFRLTAAPFLAACTAGVAWADIVVAEPAPANIATAQPAPAEFTIAHGLDGSLDAAIKAVRDGQDDEALAMIVRAAATHVAPAPARLVLAWLQINAGQLAKGRRSLEQAALDSADDPRVYLTLGSVALGEGRCSDARLNAAKALAVLEGTKLDAEVVRAARREAYALLTAIAEASGDWTAACTYGRTWLASDPANGPARQRLGRALFRLGKKDEAYKELTQAAKDDAKLGPAAVPMALLFVQEGNDEKAEEWFAYGAKVAPKSAAARLTWARWRLGKGRVPEARVLIEEAAALEPRSKEIEPLRGLVAWHLRELAAAERIFERLHGNAPADAGFAALLTLALVEQDDPEKHARGLELAQESVRRFPGSVDALVSLGRAHARSGHRDEAERLFRAAVARGGGQATPTTSFFLAQVLAEKGQTDDARRLLKSVAAASAAFAYRADATNLLASLGEKEQVKPASPDASR